MTYLRKISFWQRFNLFKIDPFLSLNQTFPYIITNKYEKQETTLFFLSSYISFTFYYILILRTSKRIEIGKSHLQFYIRRWNMNERRRFNVSKRKCARHRDSTKSFPSPDLSSHLCQVNWNSCGTRQRPFLSTVHERRGEHSHSPAIQRGSPL